VDPFRPLIGLLAADLEGGQLVLSVTDDGVGPPMRIIEGTGLSNLRQRLSTLYGEAAELRLEPRRQGMRVVVKLPAGRSGPPRAAEPEPALTEV
jgi:glucose-6-phosphate-specific signal transduction histidine kinase